LAGRDRRERGEPVLPLRPNLGPGDHGGSGPVAAGAGDRARSRGGPARRTAATALRGESADSHHRRAVGGGSRQSAPRLCHCPTGVSGRPPGGRGVPSARQPGRTGTGSGEPVESAVLIFFRFSIFFRAKTASALILGKETTG